MLTAACCLVVELALGLGLDLMSGWLDVRQWTRVFILLSVVFITLPVPYGSNHY